LLPNAASCRLQLFLRKGPGPPAPEPAADHALGDGVAAAACVLIDVFPTLSYSHLPYPVDFVSYTARHVVDTLGLLGFTALGFFLLLKQLEPEPIVSLDTDWFYRRGLSASLPLVNRGLARLESFVGQIYGVVMQRYVL